MSLESAKVAAEGGAQVVELAAEESEPCWDRTSDPLLKSRSEPPDGERD